MDQPKGKIIYKIVHILKRATGGIKQRPMLHLFSTLTLAAAFLSFAATLTVAQNLNSLIDGWVGNSEMTVYLKSDTSEANLEKLRIAISEINGVDNVISTTSQEAREQFSKDLDAFSKNSVVLPQAAFPASIDIHLSNNFAQSPSKRHNLASRLTKVNMVEEVELYDDWFTRLSAMSTMGKTAAWGLGILAAIVAILVVAGTVRQGVTARRREISVMRFVGATDHYVRMPFLLEGAMEATIAMGIALVSLSYIMNHLVIVMGDIMPLLGGNSIIRLDTEWFIYLFAGGILAGVLGARLSLGKLENL
jgi:cell division transport system permease protein